MHSPSDVHVHRAPLTHTHIPRLRHQRQVGTHRATDTQTSTTHTSHSDTQTHIHGGQTSTRHAWTGDRRRTIQTDRHINGEANSQRLVTMNTAGGFRLRPLQTPSLPFLSLPLPTPILACLGWPGEILGSKMEIETWGKDWGTPPLLVGE